MVSVFDNTNGEKWRIPALVMCGNTLVAAANNNKTGADWGYIELNISRSTDRGKTWSAPFAIATPPARVINNDIENTKSAFFIDPCMTVAANGNIVLLITFFPESKGCHDMSLLEKKKVARASFDGKPCPVLYDRDGNYYLVLENGIIIDKTKSKTPYVMRGIGELFKGEEYVGNIYLNGAKGKANDARKTTFGAPLKAPKRSYIFMLKSTDAGATWSAPQDITPQILDDEDEAFFGVAPGSALTTQSGRLIFPLYSEKGTFCIYSDDNGKNWNRCHRPLYTGAQGEWTAVETENGTIYAIGRKKGKPPVIVSTDNGITWAKAKPAPFKEPHCQKNAVFIDGTLYVSHPDGNSRENGVIHTAKFLYNKHGNLKDVAWCKAVTPINQGFFAYSCMADIGQGQLGMLYENQPSGSIVFEKFNI